ncbi:ninjurin-A isoform X1 [Vanessa cardui]|uniref:ninjurin-A isoform X1 n=2 Tax=Vanessa cardui TaxID=171605 RepID=UPI001F129058|nr:ninjurin-A isoform X1 [Vanessa cardui]
MSTEGHVLNHRMETPGFHRAPKTLDVNDVEMIFGTPASPRGRIQPDVHLISNEKTNGRDKLPNNNKSDGSDSTLSSQPLLEPDKDRPKPPLAGPEIDDLDDEQPNEATPYPGIDDGLLEPNNNKPAVNGEGDEGKSDGGSHHTHPTRDDGVGTEDGKWPWPSTDETDYPYDLNGFGPRFGIDDRPGSPMMPGSIPDVNTYQQKKNLAQGMMDLALLSANANQLRYVLESSSTHPYYYPSLTFISLSIIFQIAVGVGLIMNSRYNVKDDKDICKADKINNMTVLGVFLVTIVNVFITSFSVATPTTIANMGNSIQQAG